MSSSTLVRKYPYVEKPQLIIERFLRDREGVWLQIKGEDHLNKLISSMLASSTVSLACYGAVMGLSYGPLQAVSSAIKLPILFLLTVAICLPTLYLFNLLYGGRLSARQVLALALSAITVTSTLTLAFAPITIFFLLTAPSYDFFKLLNVTILAITGIAGINFLISGMQSMNALTEKEEAQERIEQHGSPASKTHSGTVNMRLLQGWLLLYGFVGTQLGWTLRPFFGDPDRPFRIFRAIEGNFYVNIVHTVLQLFN